MKVSKVDLEKIKSIFTKVDKVGDNFIYGVTPIPNFVGDVYIHLYGDTDGWLVAYVGADEPASMIMNWGDADPKAPSIGTIQATTLEFALHKAGNAIGAVIPPRDIKYYDFEAPEANSMALFVRTRIRAGTSSVQVELPATSTL